MKLVTLTFVFIGMKDKAIDIETIVVNDKFVVGSTLLLRFG
jgi:hypothetical protein